MTGVFQVDMVGIWVTYGKLFAGFGVQFSFELWIVFPRKSLSAHFAQVIFPAAAATPAASS